VQSVVYIDFAKILESVTTVVTDSFYNVSDLWNEKENRFCAFIFQRGSFPV